jgi:hypothetical protein
MQATQPLYLSDFMTGILATLALKQIPVLSLRENRLDQAFSLLNQDILQEATKAGLEMKFRIRTHPIHQDSTVLQQALYEAAQRDLISLDNPEFQKIRLKINAADAPAFLQDLPGTREMYMRLADLLLKYYYEQETDSEVKAR